MIAPAVTALLLLSIGGTAFASRVKYNTAGGPVPGKLNVHLVAHTHDGTRKLLPATTRCPIQTIQQKQIKTFCGWPSHSSSLSLALLSRLALDVGWLKTVDQYFMGTCRGIAGTWRSQSRLRAPRYAVAVVRVLAFPCPFPSPAFRREQLHPACWRAVHLGLCAACAGSQSRPEVHLRGASVLFPVVERGYC